METYNLHTEAGHGLNGTVYQSLEVMLEDVRHAYGRDCDFGITDGTILDAGGALVGTFGANATSWLGEPVAIITSLDLGELWLSREYVGVRVMHTPAVVGDILPPSVDMPDGDIRHECSKCSHATGGEAQRGDCECGDCDGLTCEHDMCPVVLDGTCVFFAPTLDSLTEAIKQAVNFGTDTSLPIVIVGSNKGCRGHDLCPEYMGALMVEAEVLGILR